MSEVSRDDVQILFADKEEPPKLYKPADGRPGLLEKMHTAGIKFYSPIVEPASPIMTFLLSWIVPIGISCCWVVCGQPPVKMGSMNAMQLGKSNEDYIESETGTSWTMSPGGRRPRKP